MDIRLDHEVAHEVTLHVLQDYIALLPVITLFTWILKSFENWSAMFCKIWLKYWLAITMITWILDLIMKSLMKWLCMFYKIILLCCLNYTVSMDIEILHELTSYDLWLFLGEWRGKLESKYAHKFFIKIYCIQDQIIKNKNFTKIMISSNSFMNWLQMTYKTASWPVITLITWILKSFMNWLLMSYETASCPEICLCTNCMQILDLFK